MRRLCVAVWPTRNTTSKTEPRPMRGTIIVPIMKPLVLTRVRYSRLMMSRILRTSRPINEDFAQRGLQQLEAWNFRIRKHRSLQDFLRLGAGLQLGLDARDEPRDLVDPRMIQETVAAGEFDVQRVLAVRLLDGAQLAVEYVPALVNQADGIAEALDLLHAVGGEDDGRTLTTHFEHDLLNRGGVHRIQAGERLAGKNPGGGVNHRGGEPPLFLHAL